MSNSKLKPLFSYRFLFTIGVLVVMAGFALILILTTNWQTLFTSVPATQEADIKQQTSDVYDRNQILVDTTSEPLEIVELPSLEVNK